MLCSSQQRQWHSLAAAFVCLPLGVAGVGKTAKGGAGSWCRRSSIGYGEWLLPAPETEAMLLNPQTADAAATFYTRTHMYKTRWVCVCVCVWRLLLLVCIATAAVVNNKFPLELQQILQEKKQLEDRELERVGERGTQHRTGKWCKGRKEVHKRIARHAKDIDMDKIHRETTEEWASEREREGALLHGTKKRWHKIRAERRLMKIEKGQGQAGKGGGTVLACWNVVAVHILLLLLLLLLATSYGCSCRFV